MKKVASVRITADLERRGQDFALAHMSHEQLKAALQKHGGLWWLAGSLPMLKKESQ